jgi:hypothetical protein
VLVRVQSSDIARLFRLIDSFVFTKPRGLTAEKKVVSRLLAPPKTSEKLYKIDEHVSCAVAGLTSDANILITYLRRVAQFHRLTYQV